MCEFTQREYSCGHFRFIAARWCNHYRVSHRRCSPDVAHFEYRLHEVCGVCQPHAMPEWFHSIKPRPAPATPYPLAPTLRPSRRPARTWQQQPKPASTRPPVPLFRD